MSLGWVDPTLSITKVAALAQTESGEMATLLLLLLSCGAAFSIGYRLPVQGQVPWHAAAPASAKGRMAPPLAGLLDFGTANVDPTKLKALEQYRQAKAEGRNVKFEDFLPKVAKPAAAGPPLPLPLLLGGALAAAGGGAVLTGVVELPF